MRKPCVFLDRDGVLNQDNVNYTYLAEKFEILPGVPQALKSLKDAGYLLIIVTNQSGIAKGIYQEKDVWNCYHYLQEHCGGLIDDHYFAPHHPEFTTASLRRKPDSLMIEQAAAKHKVKLESSWIVGDSPRDMVAAQKVGLKTIWLPFQSAKYQTGDENRKDVADFIVRDLPEASQLILDQG